MVGDWLLEDVGEVFEAVGCCYVLWGWLVVVDRVEGKGGTHE